MFQFTHPRGVRCLHDLIIIKLTSFNSRTREGCDRAAVSQLRSKAVSIHAPARGAITTFFNIITSQSFNSRTREGCDQQISCLSDIELFQFTHPRGVR